MKLRELKSALFSLTFSRAILSSGASFATGTTNDHSDYIHLPASVLVRHHDPQYSSSVVHYAHCFHYYSDLYWVLRKRTLRHVRKIVGCLPVNFAIPRIAARRVEQYYCIFRESRA